MLCGVQVNQPLNIPPMPSLKAKSSITVIGRRWFQRTYGNTYHTAEILIDGISVHKTAKTYGYGSCYEQSAAEWLESAGVLKLKRYPVSGGTEPLWQAVRERMGLAWSSIAQDVSRERDL